VGRLGEQVVEGFVFFHRFRGGASKMEHLDKETRRFGLLVRESVKTANFKRVAILDDFDPLLVAFGRFWILPGGFWHGWAFLLWGLCGFSVGLVGFVTSCCLSVRDWLWIICAGFHRLTGFGRVLRYLVVFWEVFASFECFLCGFGTFGAAGRVILRFPSF